MASPRALHTESAGASARHDLVERANSDAKNSSNSRKSRNIDNFNNNLTNITNQDITEGEILEMTAIGRPVETRNQETSSNRFSIIFRRIFGGKAKVQSSDRTTTPSLKYTFTEEQKRHPAIGYRFSRVHGFQYPFNYKQVLTWIWLTYSQGLYIYLNIQFNQYRYILFLNALLFLLLFFFGWKVTLSDPTDPLVYL